jgi:hypothetical protein
MVPPGPRALTVLTDGRKWPASSSAKRSPGPADLVAKGLTAGQSAEVARRSLAVLEALPDLRLETAEPPMRALVESWG